MTLLNRISSLFQADVHGLLDSIEDPVATLKQAVREMEVAVLEDEACFQQLSRRHEQLRRLHADSVRALSELEGQVQLSLTSAGDELTRTVIRKKLEEENRIREIDRVSERVEAARASLDKQLTERRERLQATRKKMEVFIVTAASEAEAGIGSRPRVVADEDVELTLLKLKQELKQERSSK